MVQACCHRIQRTIASHWCWFAIALGPHTIETIPPGSAKSIQTRRRKAFSQRRDVIDRGSSRSNPNPGVANNGEVINSGIFPRVLKAATASRTISRLLASVGTPGRAGWAFSACRKSPRAQSQRGSPISSRFANTRYAWNRRFVRSGRYPLHRERIALIGHFKAPMPRPTQGCPGRSGARPGDAQTGVFIAEMPRHKDAKPNNRHKCRQREQKPDRRRR